MMPSLSGGETCEGLTRCSLGPPRWRCQDQQGTMPQHDGPARREFVARSSYPVVAAGLLPCALHLAVCTLGMRCASYTRVVCVLRKVYTIRWRFVKRSPAIAFAVLSGNELALHSDCACIPHNVCQLAYPCNVIYIYPKLTGKRQMVGNWPPGTPWRGRKRKPSPCSFSMYCHPGSRPSSTRRRRLTDASSGRRCARSVMPQTSASSSP